MEVGSSSGLAIGWVAPLRVGHGEAYTRAEGGVNRAWTAGNDGIFEVVEVPDSPRCVPLQIVRMATRTPSSIMRSILACRAARNPK